MGRAGSGGHSGGHSSGGHSSSRTSGGHSFGGGSSHRAGSGSSHSGPSFGGGYHSNPFGNYNHYGPIYVGRRFYGGGGFSGITGIIILIVILVAMFGGLSTKGSIPASTQNREKVQTGVAFNNNCIVDDKVATAKAQAHMNKMTSGVNTDVSMAAFDRMEAKANKMLDEANAEAELNAGVHSTDDLADKYASGGNDVSVDDELARMKAELGL